MKYLAASLLLFTGFAAAEPAGNYPYLATASLTGTSHLAQFTSAEFSIVSSLAAQPAYTSFLLECSTTYSLLPTQASIALENADCDPVDLALSAADPSTTPSWVTQLPQDMQAYLGTVDAALQSAAQKINGNGASGLVVSIEAMLLSAVMAVVAYL